LAIGEFNTVCLPGTVFHRDIKEDDQAPNPPLRRTIGINQRSTTKVRIAIPDRRNRQEAFQRENNNRGARKRSEEGRNPAASPRTAALPTTDRFQQSQPSVAAKKVSTIYVKATVP
jgi:hypothetical protein